MAKRKKAMMEAPIPWKPPSPKERMKMAADDMARTMVENHPKLKAIRDRISNEVTRAAGRVINSHGMKKSME